MFTLIGELCRHPIKKVILDKPLTVLIADDHRLICEGIKLVLEQDNIKVVGRAASGRQAVEKV